MTLRILLVDDDPSIVELLAHLLKDKEFHVESASDGVEALNILEKKQFDIVVADLMMPRMGGLALLGEVKDRYSDVVVVFLSGEGTIETAVQAIKLGAYDYIQKPVDREKFLKLIEILAERRRGWEERVSLESDRRNVNRFENMLGQTPQMLRIFEEIKAVSKANASVLIDGENGTGKELIADAIHFRSFEHGKPYIKVNCGALAEGIVESELFGHEKGAYTGATSVQKGRLEMADNGTLFLDEIGELSPPAQVKLLRVLENGEFQRVGGTETRKVSIRLICATNKNLVGSIVDKEFREDLYYRINTVIIHAPPLRERRADIPLLVDYFLKKLCREAGKDIVGISREAMRILMTCEWHGNVRELAHAIERSLIYCHGEEITPEDLPPEIRETTHHRELLMSRSLAEVESSHIYNVLLESEWNLSKALKTLKIARGTLYSKMEKYGITKPD